MQFLDDTLFGPQIQSTHNSNASERAALFTVLVAVKDSDRIMHCQRLAHKIAKNFPCKIIFISIDSQKKSGFLEQSSSTRTITTKTTPMSCDVVTIHASIDQMETIPFLIIPETIPDTPVFLLVDHSPSELQSLINTLLLYTNRVIFDTQHLSNIGQFAQHMRSLLQKNKYFDLNWIRTKPWRESLATFFNSLDKFEQLQTVSHINIQYSQLPETTLPLDTQALLLQGWLADRLQWTVLDVQADRIQYQSKTQHVTISLIPCNSTLIEEGGITNIEIKGNDGLHIAMHYEHDDKHIAIHASSKDRCEMPYTLFVGSFQHGKRLPTEMFHGPASKQYLPLIDYFSHDVWNKKRG